MYFIQPILLIVARMFRPIKVCPNSPCYVPSVMLAVGSLINGFTGLVRGRNNLPKVVHHMKKKNFQAFSGE